MSIIAKLKSLVFEDYYSPKISLQIIGLRIFQLGVLLLAAAPAIAFFLLLISSIFGAFNREINYFNDKSNFPFLIVAFLMLINCIFITINNDNKYSFDISNIWFGLSNWIPFFWCFWGFQPFLKSSKLRIKTAKLLIIGSIPVLLSGFCQYFLKIYGPYNFFNNLIIWYQRPLSNENGVTGLFNNQNYAGAWLSIILPLCLVFLIKKNKNKLIEIAFFFLNISFVYMIVLTTSRGAILAIFITIFLFTKSIKNKFYILISFFSIPLILNLIPIISLKLQSIIYQFLPYELIKKTSLINIPNLNLFPRIEVWIKSIDLIKSNPIIGYGAGTFKSLYKLSNGTYGDMQHTHNIFLEIAINHGLLSAFIIIIMMLLLTIFSWKKYSKNLNEKSVNSNSEFKDFDKAWIISFIIFFLIHMFDITYFDGRISTLAWILLSGMRSYIKEKSLI